MEKESAVLPPPPPPILRDQESEVHNDHKEIFVDGETNLRIFNNVVEFLSEITDVILFRRLNILVVHSGNPNFILKSEECKAARIIDYRDGKLLKSIVGMSLESKFVAHPSLDSRSAHEDEQSESRANEYPFSEYSAITKWDSHSFLFLRAKFIISCSVLAPEYETLMIFDNQRHHTWDLATGIEKVSDDSFCVLTNFGIFLFSYSQRKIIRILNMSNLNSLQEYLDYDLSTFFSNSKPNSLYQTCCFTRIVRSKSYKNVLYFMMCWNKYIRASVDSTVLSIDVEQLDISPKKSCRKFNTHYRSMIDLKVSLNIYGEELLIVTGPANFTSWFIVHIYNTTKNEADDPRLYHISFESNLDVTGGKNNLCALDDRYLIVSGTTCVRPKSMGNSIRNGYEENYYKGFYIFFLPEQSNNSTPSIRRKKPRPPEKVCGFYCPNEKMKGKWAVQNIVVLERDMEKKEVTLVMSSGSSLCVGKFVGFEHLQKRESIMGEFEDLDVRTRLSALLNDCEESELLEDDRLYFSLRFLNCMSEISEGVAVVRKFRILRTFLCL